MKLTYEQRVERLAGSFWRQHRYYSCRATGYHIDTLDCGPLCGCGEPAGIHDLPKYMADGTGRVLTYSPLRRGFVGVEREKKR